MRSSELRKLKLFEMRIKTWNFRTTTHGVRSNAFLTTVSAHCALRWPAVTSSRISRSTGLPTSTQDPSLVCTWSVESELYGDQSFSPCGHAVDLKERRKQMLELLGDTAAAHCLIYDLQQVAQKSWDIYLYIVPSSQTQSLPPLSRPWLHSVGEVGILHSPCHLLLFGSSSLHLEVPFLPCVSEKSKNLSLTEDYLYADSDLLESQLIIL